MKNYILTKKKLEDLKDLTCEGYYWMSDATEPQLLQKEKLGNFIEALNQQLPFVLEAHFYCKNENWSISYKNIDGKAHLQVIDLNLVRSTYKTIREYKGIVYQEANEKLKRKLDFSMCEIWEEIEDTEQLMEGMKSLQPTMSVFTGFQEK